MFSIKAMSSILQKDNPYPYLALLESGLICRQESDDKTIPQGLLDDMNDIYGQEARDEAINCLLDLEAFRNTDKGLSINDSSWPTLLDWLNKVKRNLGLTLNDDEENIEDFIIKLLSYLKTETSCSVIRESITEFDFLLSWEEKKYSIQVAFSPIWLPVAAEKAEIKDIYIALMGPFASQNWQQMIKYYAYPKFRNYVSYFDPWNCQKMNISQGGLFTYFDWFFRDVYGLKFIIPDIFRLGLHDMGLLRFNDEK